MKLAAIGDNCMDVYSTGEAFPGGNPVNVAVYYARLGGEASYTGVVGTDAYGTRMKSAIAAKGVDVSHVLQTEGKTAVTHVELVNGDRVFGDYEEGVLADFRPTPQQLDFVCGHDLVVTALWGNVHDELAKIHARGVKIAYDAATRPDSVPAQTAVRSADYFFFSAKQDTQGLRERMKTLHAQGPEIVVATLGSAGSIAYDGAGYTTFGIIPCEAVDTLGAGDSYIAGFLKGIAEKKPLKECMKMGASNASVTLGYFGAW